MHEILIKMHCAFFGKNGNISLFWSYQLSKYGNLHEEPQGCFFACPQGTSVAWDAFQKEIIAPYPTVKSNYFCRLWRPIRNVTKYDKTLSPSTRLVNLEGFFNEPDMILRFSEVLHHDSVTTREQSRKCRGRANREPRSLLGCLNVAFSSWSK
jgi:hypothetical protein